MKDKTKVKGKGGIFPILAVFGEIILSIGMLLYLGKHSLNFFMFTFKGQDELYSWLGLLTTSAGAIIWLGIFLFLANNRLEKAVSLIMVVVSLLGEFAAAAFDMWLNTSGALEGGAAFTPDDIRNMSYLVAGLALLHGVALVLQIAGDAIVAAFNGKAFEDTVEPTVAETISARSDKKDGVGFPTAAPQPSTARKEQSTPMMQPKNENRVVWTESADGSRHRVYCLICREQGAEWTGPMPCQHVRQATGSPVSLQSSEPLNAQAVKADLL